MMGLVIEPMCQQIPQNESLRHPLGGRVAEIPANLFLGKIFHVLNDPSIFGPARGLGEALRTGSPLDVAEVHSENQPSSPTYILL